MVTINIGKRRITNRFKPIARGRHGACLRKPRAGNTTGLSLPGQCPPSVLTA